MEVQDGIGRDRLLLAAILLHPHELARPRVALIDDLAQSSEVSTILTPGGELPGWRAPAEIGNPQSRRGGRIGSIE